MLEVPNNDKAAIAAFHQEFTMRFVTTLALAVATLVCQEGAAVVRFELPDVLVPINGIDPSTSSFEVTVRADAEDLPATVVGFNVDLGVATSDITLDDAETPANPLLPTGTLLNFSSSDQVVRTAQDLVNQSPSSTPLIDGLGLIRVPFTVAAGKFGDYEVAFGSINELSQPTGGVFSLDTSDTGTITAFLRGDYNRDGVVDAADYTTYRDALGQPVSIAYEGADGDGDLVVDEDDLGVWQNMYGASLGIPQTSIPEPAGLLLATLLATMTASRPRRR